MIPILISWSRQLNCQPGKMMMPLSFAAQLGGCLTLIGSSHCLVAKEAIDPKDYDMGFWDMFPVGACAMFASIAAMLLFMPLLTSSDAPHDEVEKAELGSDQEG